MTAGITHPPRMWRELHRGQTGPDVEAFQRCLWHYLGASSTNARNGTYGKQTVADVTRARHMLVLPGGGESAGMVLFDQVWPEADALAVARYARVPAGVEWAPGLKRNPLSLGMKGSDVEAAQRGLWRLLGDRSQNARNGVYGDGTAADVLLARQALDLEDPAGGRVIGLQLWAALTRWFDATAISLAAEAPDPPPPVSELRDKIVARAALAYQHRSAYRYAQERPMNQHLEEGSDAHPEEADCSEYSTLAHKDEGAPNPNRSDGVYDGYGWTGSIEQVCHWVAAPLPGDFAMYPDHMAVCDGDGGVYSDGHNPIEHYPTPHYRSDFRGFMRSPHLIPLEHRLAAQSSGQAIVLLADGGYVAALPGGANPFPLPVVPAGFVPLDPDDVGDQGDTQSAARPQIQEA